MGYRTHHSLPDSALTAVIVVNCVPAVGLFYFDRSVVGLAVFYWLEFTALAVWAIVRAAFAGKRSEAGYDSPILGDDRWENAGISVPRTDVGVRYRTIPALLIIAPLFAVLWAGFGGLVVGPVVAANPAAEVPLWAVIGAIVVFATEGGRVASEYFYKGAYRETTGWGAVRGLFRQGLVLVGVGLLVVLIAREFADGRPISLEGAATGPLVFAVVALKFTADLTEYRFGALDRPLHEAI